MTKTDGIIYNMTNNDIEEKITQYLSVKEEEKNKYGEVFTPINVIEELLNKLPPSIWSNPKLKWLDPANGIGNFPMLIYQHLMKGLETWEPNDNARSKHIIQNMLFMIELNPKNVKISKNIFGSNANICCANFLTDTEGCFSQFGTSNFDIIIGNPPFQTEQKGKRKGGIGGKTLWDKFIIKSLELLVPNGYLCFITPSGWRKPDNSLYELMTKQNQLVYLHIIGERQGQQLFNVSQRIDLYILKKHSPIKNTEIIDELDNKLQLDVSKWDFLPNYNYDLIKKIITSKDNGIKIIYSSSQYDKRRPYISIKKKDKFIYPVLHSHTIKNDNIIYWTNMKTPDVNSHVKMFDVPKVILTKGFYVYPYNDYNGKYGMSNYSFGIPIYSKKHGDDIVKALNSEKFKDIIKSTKWNSRFTDHNMFSYFKPDFYKYFLQDNNKGKSKSKKSNNKTTKKQTKKVIIKHVKNNKTLKYFVKN